MKINNPIFKARHIASTKNVYKNITTNIDLYELSKRDKNFLKKLQAEVDCSKRLPNLCEYYRKRWQKVFNYAIDNALNTKDMKTYMAFSKNKPCGIMTVEENGNKLYLDSICDIPDKQGKRVNYTGSTLFCQLFKLADEVKAKAIELSAVPDGAINVVKKYEDKGFKIVNQTEDYVMMECSKFKLREQLVKLLSEISYKPVKNPEEINLNEFF